jgi:hypothetical protein
MQIASRVRRRQKSAHIRVHLRLILSFGVSRGYFADTTGTLRSTKQSENRFLIAALRLLIGDEGIKEKENAGRDRRAPDHDKTDKSQRVNRNEGS